MKRILAVLLLTAACKPVPEAPTAPKFTVQQLSAQFPADLGPAELDVSAYPARIQEGYTVFAKVCSQCHTPARALYAPVTTRADWDKHVSRMHQKTLVYGWWTAFQKEDAKRVLDFLAYDSQVRKVDAKASFAETTAALEALFLEVRREKDRVARAEDARSVKPAAPYVGAKP